MGNKKEKIIQDIALVGYQSAIQLFLEEEGRAWERFNVMLVANSIIIASIHILPTEKVLFKTYSCGFGIFLCVIWLLLMFRAIDYRDYYILKAREIEERYLVPYVNIISKGDLYSNGKKIPVFLNEMKVDIKMSNKAKILRGSKAIILVISSFIIYYFLILFTM